MPKAISFRAHAKKRAMERFGLDLKRADLDAIATFILSGKAHEVESGHSGRSLWQLNLNGQDVVAVFDSPTGVVVSFLTKNQALKNTKRWRRA